ncbi:MAG: V-type ATP synthase subunit I [Acholeplasmataceae bacterium]
MGISAIKLIDITANQDKLDDILTKLIETEHIHPVLASEIIEKVHGSTSFVSENPCQALLQDVKDIETKFNIHLTNVEQRNYDIDFDEMYDYMQNLKHQLNEEIQRIKALEKDISEYQDARIQVNHLKALDLPLDDLFAAEYVTFRFGRLPNDSVPKLRFFQSKAFVFQSFETDHNYAWCMYYTTDEFKREVDNIFSSLFFERIFIPDFVHGRPLEAIENLESKIKAAQLEIQSYHQEMDEIAGTCTNKLSCIKGELLYLNRLFEAKKYVVGLGDKISISLFVEDQHALDVKSSFETIDDVEVEINDADTDKRIQPPTKLKNGWFAKPFGLFVEMYGLPSYHDIDPTPFVAWSYAILFGLMFGDLGQGIVLALLGYLLYKKKGSMLGAIGVRIGITSAIFGFLYGSLFGNEEILIPVFQNVFGLIDKPIHVMDADFTMTLLISAIGIGVFLIVIAMFLSIYIKLKKKHYVEMFMSHNGVAGLILYTYALTALALSMGFQINILTPVFTLPFIGIPLLLIFLKEPVERKSHGEKMFPNGFGGFFVEGFFELFEILLSYVTNTMSFLRVGGFILSHAGMMLVVMSLMEMVGNTGSIFVLIFGNIFVMVLEGMIVGIQVLRLQFYELFSRYYQGDGIAFTPLQIK